MKPITIPQQMIPAVLDGTKTRHSVVIDPQPKKHSDIAEVCGSKCDSVIFYSDKSKGGHRIDTIECPYKIGEKVWVPEEWDLDYSECDILFKDGGRKRCLLQEEYFKNEYERLPPLIRSIKKFRNADSMPQWASRITLEITNIRVERLWDITWDDADAEGFKDSFYGIQRPNEFELHGNSSMDHFRDWWMSSYGDQSWLNNDWVWVYEFKRV